MLVNIGYEVGVTAERIVMALPWWQKQVKRIWRQAKAEGIAVDLSTKGFARSVIIIDTTAGKMYVRSVLTTEELARRIQRMHVQWNIPPEGELT